MECVLSLYRIRYSSICRSPSPPSGSEEIQQSTCKRRWLQYVGMDTPLWALLSPSSQERGQFSLTVSDTREMEGLLRSSTGQGGHVPRHLVMHTKLTQRLGLAPVGSSGFTPPQKCRPSSGWAPLTHLCIARKEGRNLHVKCSKVACQAINPANVFLALYVRNIYSSTNTKTCSRTKSVWSAYFIKFLLLKDLGYIQYKLLFPKPIYLLWWLSLQFAVYSLSQCPNISLPPGNSSHHMI